MRVKRRLLGFAVLLSVLLSAVLVVGLGVVDMSKLPFGGALADPPPTATVFSDPVFILDETKQSGSFVSFHVNISDATDLYAWQLNLTWNPAILNVSDVDAGEFLLRTASPDQTAAAELGYVINVTDYGAGYVCLSESILGEVGGETGSGRLVSVEFEVVGYGSTNLTISLAGTLPTTLLDSTMVSIPVASEDGYFRNKYPGDIDGTSPWDCDYDDFNLFAAAYLKTSAHAGYNPEADFDYDGDVDYDDFNVFAANYLKTFP